MPSSEKQKKWTKRLGIPVLALIVFVFALHFTFPYHRVEDLLVQKIGAYYEVSSLHVSPGIFPGRIVLNDVALRTRPEREGEKPIEIGVDELSVNIGLLALLQGETDVAISATMGEGVVSGRVSVSDEETRIVMDTDDLPLANLPGIKSVIGGVPMAGGLKAHVDLTLPNGHWKEAEGTFAVACDSCTIGDGIAKIRPMAAGQTNAFADEGLTLPRLKLGKIGGKMVLAKGTGRFEHFEATSSDGEFFLEGDVRFDDPVSRSQVTAYLRFKSSDTLKQREPRMADMELMMGAAGRRPDGTIGVRITGPMSGLRYITSKTSPLPNARDNFPLPPASANVRPMPPRPSMGAPFAGGAPPPVAPVEPKPSTEQAPSDEIRPSMVNPASLANPLSRDDVSRLRPPEQPEVAPEPPQASPSPPVPSEEPPATPELPHDEPPVSPPPESEQPPTTAD